MAHTTLRILSLLLLCIAVSFAGSVNGFASGFAPQTEPQLTDSLYNANHPRLLFTDAEIPALYSKVRDGGYDDYAYSFIRLVADLIYPYSTEIELLSDDFGMVTVPNLGLAGFLETPKDTSSLAIGRNLTLYIADNYNVDSNNDFDSSLRLRALTLGYDLFFENGSESDRDNVRNEIVSYIDTMIVHKNFELFRFRPYLSNRSMMTASSAGLAAICLAGEIDSLKVAAALDMADSYISKWLIYQLDSEGAYKEGLLYGAWSMRNLIYYFHARKKYDGFDYSNKTGIRNMENWFAYELLPEGSGRTNNLNDCSYNEYVLSRHHTYFDWAQAAWGSRLSAWLFDYTAGVNGWDWGLKADKAATAIWNQNLPLEEPGDVLPESFIWKDRGLYYFRSGWTLGSGSNDVMFSYYAGKFHGGHAQEDQGQFTLYGYGAKFAIDHGYGSTAKQSEAHNIVFIDDLGQHNAGSSIGTDGKIYNYLLSSYADFLFSDLTSAYTTHSVLNNPNVPFLGTDWSWGYDGGNPVNYALRTVIGVHDSLLPPYFIIIDDIEKDGSSHQYEWRMHTYDGNSINTSANPIQITNGSSTLDLYLVTPDFGSVQTSITPFNNLSAEPDALILSISKVETNPLFTLLLFPRDGSVPVPIVSQETFPWGFTIVLDWGGGVTDHFMWNTSGDTITYTASAAYKNDRPPRGGPGNDNKSNALTTATAITDASFAITRIDGTQLKKYLLSETSTFTFNDTIWISVSNGTMSCGLSGGEIKIDRYDADFSLYAPGVNQVYYRGQKIYVNFENGYVTPDPILGVTNPPRSDTFIRAKAYPNPFNPSTTILLELPVQANVVAAIYDSSGRLVRYIWRGLLPRGTSALRWDGTNDNGNLVASGVYFLRIQSHELVKTLKLVFIK